MNSLEKGTMKQILHTSRAAYHNRAKIIKIVEKAEDSECLTQVRKTFIYVVSAVVDETQKLPEPQIKIRKSFDTKTREEKFAFRIKGGIYVNHNRRLLRVDYSHTLRINLKWKTKVFSPKKSVTMA
jgi:vacuolar-type H+-ATPase subunit E/Vma4